MRLELNLKDLDGKLILLKYSYNLEMLSLLQEKVIHSCDNYRNEKCVDIIHKWILLQNNN